MAKVRSIWTPENSQPAHSLNSLSCWASISTYTKKIPRPLWAICLSPLSCMVSSWCHVVYAPARTPAAQATRTPWKARCVPRATRHVPLRITGERARFRGRLVRETARHGCRLSACSVSLTRSAVPGGTRHLLHGNHPERDATSASWPGGDCRTPGYHTQPWVCAPHHLGPPSGPCWDLCRHRCYTLRQPGRAWVACHPSMHAAPAKEADDGYCRRPAISP